MSRPVARPRGRMKKADAKRRAILEGARWVFLQDGFGGARMDGIAAAAGVSKMTIYRHFQSKEQLFAGVIQDLCRQIIDKDIMEAMDALPPEQALRMFARRMLLIVFSPETLGLHLIVIAESRRFPDLGRLFYEQGPEGSIVLLTEFLQKHAGNSRLRITDPRRNAEEFMSLLRGYAHLRSLLGLESRAPDFSDAIESAVGHLTR